MRIAIVGPGNIGSNCARRFIRSGRHEVKLSFSRHPEELAELAGDLGDRASFGTPQDAVTYADVIVLSVPWDIIPEALRQMGSLAGKIIIDTTNQFGSHAQPSPGQTAAEFNASRMPGARYTKSFNTLTARFQREAADRPKDQKVVQWICGDEEEAKRVVAELIEDAGYVPVDFGGTKTCQLMEAPRRHGAVYGEEYRASDGAQVIEAVRQGRPIPPLPKYA